MRSRLDRFLAPFLGALILAFAAPAFADTVTVFAAASLREAVDSLARAFEASTAHRVVASYGASNALARQVEAGAPADIFISADTAWADHVEARGLATAGLRRDVAGNELVLVAPASSRVALSIAPAFPLAGALQGRRLAIANPDAVPAGKYARAALVALGTWEPVKQSLAPAESVRGALSFVARGESPLGIVYKTDALAERSVRIVDTFPAAIHPRIVYPLLVLKRANAAAKAFADYLSSAEAQPTWRRFGFTAGT